MKSIIQNLHFLQFCCISIAGFRAGSQVPLFFNAAFIEPDFMGLHFWDRKMQVFDRVISLFVPMSASLSLVAAIFSTIHFA